MTLKQLPCHICFRENQCFSSQKSEISVWICYVLTCTTNSRTLNIYFFRFPSQSGGSQGGGQGGSGADNPNLYDDGDDDLYS